MNIKHRLKKLETAGTQNFDDWLKSLSDGELERITSKRGKIPFFTEWLKALTDEELEIIRYGKPGATALKRKFNEYKKQVKET